MIEVREKTCMNSVRLAQVNYHVGWVKPEYETSPIFHCILALVTLSKDPQISKFCVVKKDHLFVRNLNDFLNNCILKEKNTEGYSKPCQTSKM